MSDIVEQIAAELDETNLNALADLRRLVEVLGPGKAMTLLEQTREVMARGGMLTDKGQRQRTPGGIFFKLAKNQTTVEQRVAIWPRLAVQKAAPLEPPTLDEIKQVIQAKGETSTVKITLIGRPGRVIEKGDVVLTSLQSSGKVPSLPKGVPAPPSEPTTYVVYIARKQWAKVKGALEDPADALIVEGYPAFDKRLNGMAVYVQSATTKNLQRAQREAQKAESK